MRYSYRNHLLKGVILGGIMVLSLNSPELTQKTLSHKGFSIILINHILLIDWTYNLKHFIGNDLNYWKKCMKFQYCGLIFTIVFRSYKLTEKYYIN